MIFQLKFAILLFILPLLSFCKDVRITAGVDKDPVDPNKLSYETPSVFWGPNAASTLNGRCFTSVIDKTEYTVCPFQNITEKRNGALRAVLLGVWNDWIVESEFSSTESNKTHYLVNSTYTNGARCGGPKNVQKSVNLGFKCVPLGAVETGVQDLVFELKNVVDENNGCVYYMQFNFPLSCEVLRFSHRMKQLQLGLDPSIPAPDVADVLIDPPSVSTSTSSSSASTSAASEPAGPAAAVSEETAALNATHLLHQLHTLTDTSAELHASGCLSRDNYEGLMREVGVE